jgi:hypothetical protein
LPIEHEDAAQIIVMGDIGPGVYVLRNAWVKRGIAEPALLKGKEAEKVIAEQGKPSPLMINCANKIILIKGEERAF